MKHSDACVKAGLIRCDQCESGIANCYFLYYYESFIPEYFIKLNAADQIKSFMQYFAHRPDFGNTDFSIYFVGALKLFSPETYDRLHKLMVLI